MADVKALAVDELRRKLSAYLEENYTGCGNADNDEIIANAETSSGKMYFTHSGGSFLGTLACRVSNLSAVLEGHKKTFSEALLELLAKKKLKPVDFYHRAGISKEHFSKIKNNVDYQPSKPAAMAIVLALELPLADAEKLLAKAGYAFSSSLVQDLVVKFFIEEGIYDVDAVNIELYKLGRKPLTNTRSSGEI